MIVSIPILPILKRTLDAGPIGELAFICGMRGRPFAKEAFGCAFKEACKAAGVFNRSAHGCRKIGERRAAKCDLWLDRNRDGVAIHSSGGP